MTDIIYTKPGNLWHVGGRRAVLAHGLAVDAWHDCIALRGISSRGRISPLVCVEIPYEDAEKVAEAILEAAAKHALRV